MTIPDFSADARTDPVELLACSIAQWRDRRAERYPEEVLSARDLIAAEPRLNRERAEIRLPVRLHASGSHVIIHQETETGVSVLRIVHARRDRIALVER